MVNIIFFLLVIFFWYGVAVCVVQTVKHCTTREAASFCIQKIKEVFAWSWKEAFAKPPVQYMTHIGWGGKTVLQSQSCRRGTCGAWQTVPVLSVHRHPV